MKHFVPCVLLALTFISANGQSDAPIFAQADPLPVRAKGSVKNIRKNSNDSTFVTNTFEYFHDNSWKTVPVQAKVRGNYRLKNCYFPPLKLKFTKKDVTSTLFAGNKSLKLVVPCTKAGDNNTLIRKEYLCYKFYETLSPYYFLTRLATLALTEVSQKKPRDYDLLAFFVEDNSLVAKRSNGRIMETKRLSPGAFDERQALRNDFLQYMIGNADWSAVYQHNSNVLFAEGKYITLAYDFDMSGFVNAPYSHSNPPQLGTGDPRERVYRGFCKSPESMEAVRKEFLGKESVIHGIIDEHRASFNDADMKDMHDYIDQFFRILHDDNRFSADIVRGCRTQ